MKFGLSEEDLTLIRSILTAFPEIEKAIIYGSRVKGSFRPGSDVDLALVGSQLNDQVRVAVSMAFEDSSLPYLFDLCILSQIKSGSLSEHIKQDGVVIYEDCR